MTFPVFFKNRKNGLNPYLKYSFNSILEEKHESFSQPSFLCRT